MHWLMAFLGMLFGGLFAAGSNTLFGMIFGAITAWQTSRLLALKSELNRLKSQWDTQTKAAAMLAQIAREQNTASSEAKPAAPTQNEPANPAIIREDAAPIARSIRVETPDLAPKESGFDLPQNEIKQVAPVQKDPEVKTRPQPHYEQPRPKPLQRPSHKSPASPDVFSRAKAWLFDGNIPVKIGMLVLLFGMGAALKYSVDAGWLHVPLALRLVLIAIAGLMITLWGWKQREKRPAFGLTLQGGGIGILLLTTFAAYRLYALLPSNLAFALVLILVAGTAVLAVLQHAGWLAGLGFLGGYLAPVILSTGTGNHVALFSFYALLNLAVFSIAWWKHWHSLNLMGFFFTFGIGLSWGMTYYQPEHFASVEPFLILFFLFYLAIPLIHALRAAKEGGASTADGLVSGGLVFGLPLMAFPLQAALLYGKPLALAYSAVVLSIVYALLAAWMIRHKISSLLGQAYAALAIGFATLAVPLAFTAEWTCIAWSLKGTALIWIGLRNQRYWPQFFGFALHALAMLAYGKTLLAGAWSANDDEMLVLNAHALCTLLMAGSAFLTAWFYERLQPNRFLIWLTFLIGTMWWGIFGFREILVHFGADQLPDRLFTTPSVMVLYLALSFLVMAGGRRLMAWPRLGWNVLLVALLSLITAPVLHFVSKQSALEGAYGIAWFIWLISGGVALAWLRHPIQRGLSFTHVAFLATLATAYGLALYSSSEALGQDWRFFAGLLPLIVLVALTSKLPAIGAFPLASHFPRYSQRWHVPAGLVLGFSWFQALLLPGEVSPLPYLPLLNPTDLAQLFGLAIAGRWLLRHKPNEAPVLLSLLATLFLSMAGLRGVHQLTGLPWSEEILVHGVSQTTLTVMWSIIGVMTWILGSRYRHWGLWLTGALAMGIVLIKLIMVDRQYMGNLAGIVSFMAVGGLLVLVGRIAPTPPRSDISQDSA